MIGISEAQEQLVTASESGSSRTSDSQDGEPAADEGELKPFSGHKDSIRAIAYSPNGRYIATCSKDTTIRIWSSITGEQDGQTLEGHTSDVNTISYSPDGNSLVSGGDDDTVRFWDVGNGHTQADDPIALHGSSVWSVQYSPNGRLVASAGYDGFLKLWDSLTHKFVAEFEKYATSIIFCISWAPDGKRLAAGSGDNRIHIFDVEKRKLAMPPIDIHKGDVNAVAYSPDGTFFASASDDYTVRIWGAKTGRAVKTPFRMNKGAKRHVLGVAWSPDGRRLVSCSGKPRPVVWVWDVDKGQALFNGPLGDHRHGSDDWIWAVAYSPDGKRFISATGADRHTAIPLVQVRDASTGKPVLHLLSDEEMRKVQEQGHSDSSEELTYSTGKMRVGETITSVGWSSNGQRFVSVGAGGSMQTWSAETGYQVNGAICVKPQNTVSAASVSEYGTKVAAASGDATINVFDVESGEALVGPITGHADAILALGMAPDGSRIVSGGKDKTIRFWDGITGKMVYVLEAHTEAVCALSISRDVTKLASGSEDNTIIIWDWQTYDRLAGPFHHDGCVRAVCFSPDGSRVLSGSDDCTARVWKVTTGELAFDPIKMHSGSVGAVDWSSDGSRLLTTGTYDWTICVWDATTGGRIHEPLEGHDAGVKTAAFSPDCKRILSGSMDGTLCVWDVETGKILLDKTELDNQSESNSDTHSLEAQQEGISAERRHRMRQHSDDSIMNMPATISRRKQGNQGRGFWDDIDHEGGHGARSQKTVKKRERKPSWLGNMWRSPRNSSTSKGNTARKGKNSAGNTTERHAMRHVHRTEARDVAPARDKLRVLAAGDNPRGARRNSHEDPGSDGGSNSPTEPSDPNQPHADLSDDDTSVHGLIDTVCFCLCLPCCK
ncbi:WD40 repeat-like protein [Coniophora puteana RWD-64-598 SS2]|uniref:WD40 repeat-like protein n=1 Tax=Coniophora puteana (strain RWD-64-598) TaxID=741705 RepID=A0A5M3MCX8_CONPW|nr:WD40 repeat-like protein [Coniophora puteana RWD-64-598 SS2]EIW76933.1 WD40 repeat-like protein [Coniophora puteana RWD-64-598 SS2]